MRLLRRDAQPATGAQSAGPPWALLSLLLRYPDDRRAAARLEADALPAGPVRDAVRRFVAETDGPPAAQAARYVQTFDLKRRNSLYLTYYSHGDTRQRGMALLRLKKLYRADGLPMDCPELPDHLAVMLAYAALAPPGHGETVLAEHRAALELLRRSLHDDASPYAHVLDAVSLCLGELSVADRAAVATLMRDGPPEETVGLEPYAPGDVMPEGAHP